MPNVNPGAGKEDERKANRKKYEGEIEARLRAPTGKESGYYKAPTKSTPPSRGPADKYTAEKGYDPRGKPFWDEKKGKWVQLFYDPNWEKHDEGYGKGMRGFSIGAAGGTGGTPPARPGFVGANNAAVEARHAKSRSEDERMKAAAAAGQSFTNAKGKTFSPEETKARVKAMGGDTSSMYGPKRMDERDAEAYAKLGSGKSVDIARPEHPNSQHTNRRTVTPEMFQRGLDRNPRERAAFDQFQQSRQIGPAAPAQVPNPQLAPMNLPAPSMAPPGMAMGGPPGVQGPAGAGAAPGGAGGLAQFEQLRQLLSKLQGGATAPGGGGLPPGAEPLVRSRLQGLLPALQKMGFATGGLAGGIG